MPDRPIILAPWQVRAALDGWLSLVVVPLKPQPEPGERARLYQTAEVDWQIYKGVQVNGSYKLPFAPGDRLIVKEKYSTHIRIHDPYYLLPDYHDAAMGVWYWADGNPHYGDWVTPRSPVTMPRRFSRLWLAIDGVEVRRVGEIDGTKGEFRAAGCDGVGAIDEETWNYYRSQSPKAQFIERWRARYPRLPFETTWATFGRVTVHRGNIDA